MNGKDLMNNLIDELNRAEEELKKFKAALNANLNDSIIIDELIDDIGSDLDRYYDYSDSINAVLEDIEVE